MRGARALALALLGLLTAGPLPALAQTIPLPRAQVQTVINNNIKTCTGMGCITGALLNQTLTTMLSATCTIEDPGNCPASAIAGLGVSYITPLSAPYNAKCDGVTNDAAALTAAAAAAIAANVSLLIPNATCFSASALALGAINLVGATPIQVNNPPNFGPQISCAAAIAAPCVTLGNARPAVSAGTATNVVFSFTGTPIAGDNALKVLGNNTILDKVLARNAWNGFYFFGGLSAHVSWLYTLDIANDHVVQDSFPELYINQARLGGTSPTGTTNAFFGFTGNDPNSFICVQCQLNASTAPAYVWDFANFSAQVNGDYRLIDSIIDEGNLPSAVAIIHTDTTANCYRCIWDNVSTYGVGNVPMFAINPSGSIHEAKFVNSNLFVNSFTIPSGVGVVGLQLANDLFTGSLTLNGLSGSTISASNIYAVNGVTVLGGPWTQLDLSNIHTDGAYSDSAASGLVNASNVQTQAWTPALSFSTSGSATYTSSGAWSRTPTGGFWAYFTFAVSALSSPSGNISITAPMTCAHQASTVPLTIPQNFTGLTGSPSAVLLNGSTTINLTQSSSSGTTNIIGANLTSSTSFSGTVTCGVTQ